MTSDSQSRLVAYTAAAGLGAFFGGQTVEGQVTESHAIAVPSQILAPIVYLDIDGDGTNDFKFERDSYVIYIYGTRPGNLILWPVNSGWTNGMTLDATTGHTASSPYLASTYTIGFSPLSIELGFSFTGGDSKTHFGYMNIQMEQIPSPIYGPPDSLGVVVNGIYYNKTPNAAIVIGSLPPVIVSATSIQVGAKNAVTINFTSSDNAAASAFTLETSPVLGASASWTTETKAVISSNGPGIYKAVTTGTGGPSQFFRIKH